MNRLTTLIIFIALTLTGLNASAQGSLSSLDDLLKQVQDGTFRENQQNRAREQEFVQNRGRQQEREGLPPLSLTARALIHWALCA